MRKREGVRESGCTIFSANGGGCSKGRAGIFCIKSEQSGNPLAPNFPKLDLKI